MILKCDCSRDEFEIIENLLISETKRFIVSLCFPGKTTNIVWDSVREWAFATNWERVRQGFTRQGTSSEGVM